MENLGKMVYLLIVIAISGIPTILGCSPAPTIPPTSTTTSTSSCVQGQSPSRVTVWYRDQTHTETFLGDVDHPAQPVSKVQFHSMSTSTSKSTSSLTSTSTCKKCLVLYETLNPEGNPVDYLEPGDVLDFGHHLKSLGSFQVYQQSCEETRHTLGNFGTISNFTNPHANLLSETGLLLHFRFRDQMRSTTFTDDSGHFSEPEEISVIEFQLSPRNFHPRMEMCAELYRTVRSLGIPTKWVEPGRATRFWKPEMVGSFLIRNQTCESLRRVRVTPTPTPVTSKDEADYDKRN